MIVYLLLLLISALFNPAPLFKAGQYGNSGDWISTAELNNKHFMIVETRSCISKVNKEEFVYYRSIYWAHGEKAEEWMYKYQVCAYILENIFNDESYEAFFRRQMAQNEITILFWFPEENRYVIRDYGGFLENEIK